MTTTISKKNKHTKPASKKRTGKRIGIRNTKKRSKNSKKSKTSKKNKPKNRLYKGGNNDLVESIEIVVRRYNKKVLLDEDKWNGNESGKYSSDSYSIDDGELADAINASNEEINEINRVGNVIKNSHIVYSETKSDDLNDEINDEFINKEQRRNIIADAKNVKTLLNKIISSLLKKDNLVENSLEPDSTFTKAVNEYQKHIDDNTKGYIENTNDGLLLDAIHKINTDYKGQSDCC